MMGLEILLYVFPGAKTFLDLRERTPSQVPVLLFGQIDKPSPSFHVPVQFLKGVLRGNFSYKNEFDLHEIESVDVHMNGFDSF